MANIENPNLISFYQKFLAVLEKAPQIVAVNKGNKWVVAGKLPLLVDSTRPLLLDVSPWEKLSVIIVDAGPNLLGLEIPFSPQLVVGISEYQAYKAIRSNSQEQIADVEARLNATEQKLDLEAQRLRDQSLATDRAQSELENFKRNLIEEQKDALNKINKNLEESSSFVHLQEKDFRKFLTKGQEQIDAASKSAVEAGILGEAIAVWTYKAKSHSKIFKTLLWSFIGLVFVVTISLPILWILFGSYITRTTSGDVPYADLIVILATLGAIIWLARILVRLVFTERSLADDAVQRRAFLETYLRLVRDPDAEMETNDRILVLNAIFRPLPGHQTEDVAPPTIADLIRERIPR